jgi:lysophospholipase L1-like esterase
MIVYSTSMTWWQMLLAVAVLASVAYRAALIFFRAHAARVQMADEHPYKKESTDYTKTLLVLGDSTAVGVGASRPEDTVPGRLATYLGATHTENYAKSGSFSGELKEQIDQAVLDRYDVVLIMTGANDILFLHGAKETAKQLDVLMMTLPDAGKVILMTAGNVGGATIFPLIVRPLHTWLNQTFHHWFTKVAKRRGALYVNLYQPSLQDPFRKDPDRYLSEDGLHPSSDGYGLWFEKVREVLEK